MSDNSQLSLAQRLELRDILIRDLTAALEQRDEALARAEEIIAEQRQRLEARSQTGKKSLPARRPSEPRPLRTFDRKSRIRVALPDIATPPFGFVTRFRSIKLEGTDFGYGDDSPPMPMRLGPFGFYRADDDMIRMFCSLKSSPSHHVDFDDENDWVNVRTVVGQRETVSFVNGEELARYETHEEVAVAEVVIGGGYLNRSWDGQIDHLWLYKGDTAREYHAAAMEDAATLLLFDGNDILVPKSR